MSDQAFHMVHKIWLEYILVGNSIRSTLYRTFIFSSTPWLLSFIICSYFGKTILFLDTTAFHVAFLCVFFVSLALLFGSQNQFRMFDGVLDCFDLSDEQKRQIILNVMERHTNFRHQLRACLIIFFISLLAAFIGFYWWDNFSKVADFLGTQLPRFEAFEWHGWYLEENRDLGFWLVVVFVPWISMTLGTSASAFLRMPLFFLELRELDVILPPALIKSKFAGATQFYFSISIFWLIGVAALLFFFGQNGDFISLIVVIVTFLFGIVNFLIPQLSYVQVASAAEDRLLDRTALAFIKSGVGDISRKIEHEHDKGNVNAPGMMLLLRLTEHDSWVYPVHQTYIVLGSYGIPVIATYINWEPFVRFMSQ